MMLVVNTAGTCRPSVRVLISGFDAFGGESLNPTAALVQALKQGEVMIPAEMTVEAVVLPVGFETAFEALEQTLRVFKPQIVLAFGQAGGRSRIEFERLAVNVKDAEIPDNDGLQPRDQMIVEGGPVAYLSTLPIRTLVEALTAHEIPAGISNSAGLYVCNYLFYRLQKHFSDQPQILSGFVHVPYLPEQAVMKTAPSLPFEKLKEALEVVLREITKIPFRDR
ncbi:MAG: pyroglutamyl-peptidase I [Proteobacteria bacterium]|nr:MAG: pyroglutamyl-peptidase I [Pseudomonadota bacterium]